MLEPEEPPLAPELQAMPPEDATIVYVQLTGAETGKPQLVNPKS